MITTHLTRATTIAPDTLVVGALRHAAVRRYAQYV